MKSKAIIIFLILSYIAISSCAQQKKMDVTYIANAGFLIESYNKKILIDKPPILAFYFGPNTKNLSFIYFSNVILDCHCWSEDG